MSQQDVAFFQSVQLEMTDATAALSLYSLCDYLSRYYGKNAIVLLDEYDTPLQEAYTRGYWDDLVIFIRSLFNSTFKTNPFLERALLTGITRVSKESIFSDLNNLEIVTTTSAKYAASFGFTEEEVFAALDMIGKSSEKEQVKSWIPENTIHIGPRKITIFRSRAVAKCLQAVTWLIAFAKTPAPTAW